MVLSLATGQFVPPIHRKNLYSLQYSMLPAQRAAIGEVWNRLSEKRVLPVGNGSLNAPRGTTHAQMGRLGGHKS